MKHSFLGFEEVMAQKALPIEEYIAHQSTLFDREKHFHEF